MRDVTCKVEGIGLTESLWSAFMCEIIRDFIASSEGGSLRAAMFVTGVACVRCERRK